jgi:putative solute:sodium symporter small subunit
MARRKSEAEGESQPPDMHNLPPIPPAPTAPPPGTAFDPAPAHWQRTRRLTGVLLAIWFSVTFGVIFFARELSHLSLFGWPISYYMAAQGATLVYVILVGFYAWRMWLLDRAGHRENARIRSRSNSDAA